MSYDNFTHGGCKVNKPAPAIPTRVQEVDAEASEIERIHNIKQHNRADAYERLARTLAAEVDAEREVVTKLLEMLNMNTKPRPKHEDFHPFDYEQWNDAVCEWDRNAARYARALKIAGRTE